jgi:hypothetical protein
MSPENTFPDYVKLYKHTGQSYLYILSQLHALLTPQRYFEIGVNEGLTLALSKCGSLGVDPEFKLTHNITHEKPFVYLVQETSDDFFRNYDARGLLGGAPDLAFLDGLHHAEFLLRDFFNTEKISSPATVIALHDCLPIDIYCARREQFDAVTRAKTPTPATWAGDVWKTLAAIRKYRPDLRILCLNAPPTGLVLIWNLDPSSSTLEENYDDIIAWFETLELSNEAIGEFLSTQDIRSTSELADTLKEREV